MVFPDLIRALLEVQMAEHRLTIQDLRKALRKAEIHNLLYERAADEADPAAKARRQMGADT